MLPSVEASFPRLQVELISKRMAFTPMAVESRCVHFGYRRAHEKAQRITTPSGTFYGMYGINITQDTLYIRVASAPESWAVARLLHDPLSDMVAILLKAVRSYYKGASCTQIVLACSEASVAFAHTAINNKRLEML